MPGAFRMRKVGDPNCCLWHCSARRSKRRHFVELEAKRSCQEVVSGWRCADELSAQCPRWVSKTEVSGLARLLRFYPQEQTSSACPGMSVWCQQRALECKCWSPVFFRHRNSSSERQGRLSGPLISRHGQLDCPVIARFSDYSHSSHGLDHRPVLSKKCRGVLNIGPLHLDAAS